MEDMFSKYNKPAGWNKLAENKFKKVGFYNQAGGVNQNMEKKRK